MRLLVLLSLAPRCPSSGGGDPGRSAGRGIRQSAGPHLGPPDTASGHSRKHGIDPRPGERDAFAINNVGPGWYVLRCTRKAFVPAEVGQLRPGRPGMPFEITPDSQSSFFQIRMRRLGAVTGTVLDENNVGIPEWPVHLYTLRRKPGPARGRNEDGRQGQLPHRRARQRQLHCPLGSGSA